MESYVGIDAHCNTGLELAAIEARSGELLWRDHCRLDAQLLREAGMDDAANAFVDINTFGTPQQILDKMDKRRQQIGDFDLTVQVSYGGLTGEQAEKSMGLFAKEVLPELQSWETY